MKKDTLTGVFFYGFYRSLLRYCRAGCPHPAASIGVLSYVDGGLRAGRPTTKPRAVRKPCRGRRLRRPVSAGCPPRGLPRATRSQHRHAPAPTSSTEASCDALPPPRNIRSYPARSISRSALRNWKVNKMAVNSTAKMSAIGSAKYTPMVLSATKWGTM